MTEAEVANIEAQLGVLLPKDYRNVLLNYPEDLLVDEPPGSGRKFASRMLYDDPLRLLQRNQDARAEDKVYVKGSWEPWPVRFFAIGNNGGGDEWCIDLTDQSGQVWMWECGEFRVSCPSVQHHIEGLRSSLQESRDARRAVSQATTAEGWVVCSDPEPMLPLLIGNASDRKFRLFGCACAERIAHLVRNEYILHARTVAERFADGLASEEELAGARTASRDVAKFTEECALYYCTFADGFEAAGTFKACAGAVAYAAAPENARGFATERAAQAHLLRDIFGNPYRPVAFDPAWLTPTVTSLAKEIYDKKSFDEMPILADALQDADCDNEIVMAHCRSEDPHVRGCWLLDLILGKS